MSLVHRLDPGDMASAAVRLDDEPLPIASPPGTGLELCPQCGMENGITALVCWHCEAELSAGPFRHTDQAPTAADPDSPKHPHASDTTPTRDAQRGSRGSHLASVHVLGGIAEPAAPADVRALDDADADADADSRYPVLTQVVEGNDLATAFSASAAVADRRMRTFVAAGVVLVASLAAGAYLYMPAPLADIFRSSLGRDTAVRTGGITGAPGFVAPKTADPTLQTRSSQVEGVPPAVAEALAAAARALSVKPGAAQDEAGPLAASPANRSPDVAARSNAMPSAKTAALTAARRAKAGGGMPSANAPAAMPTPNRVEPARQTSERVEPCTATIAALGLCAAPPVRLKE